MARTVLPAVLVLIAVPSVLSGADKQSNAPDQGKSVESRIGELESETARLRSQVHEHEQTFLDLRSKVKDANRVAFVVVLFGAFCALWAQNTGRSAWNWFFLGLFFNIITVFVLLSKNSSDRRARVQTPSEKA